MQSGLFCISMPIGVVPVLVGPLQALIGLLPIILAGLAAVLGSIIATVFLNPKKLLRLIWTQKIALLVLAAGIVGVWFLFSHVLVSQAQVGQMAAGGDWPMWRGGPERRGGVLEKGYADPVQGRTRWQYTDGKIKAFYSSPAVVGNRVYATAADYGYFTDNGGIYSLDADTGALVWRFNGSKYRSTFSSPAVSGKYLAVGEGLHKTKDSRVFCLDVVESEKRREGVVLWEYRTQSHVESSPCIAEGKVVIGAGDDGLYCFAVEGDGQGNPKLLWHLDGKTYPDCESSPMLYKGRVYFCQGNAGQGITCVDANTGSLIWQLKTPYPVFGAPAISQGKLFAGMGNGDFVNSASDLAEEAAKRLKAEGKSDAEIEAARKKLAPAGEVWCIDLNVDKPDKPLWRFKAAETVLGAVAVAGDRLFFGSFDGNLCCVGTDGKLINKWNARAPLLGSVVVGKDHVYCVTKNGQLYGLDTDKLELAWEADLASEVYSSPAVARGRVYVGTNINGLVCAGEPRTATQKVWAGSLGGPGLGGWSRGSFLGDKGQFLWRFPEGSDESSDTNDTSATRPAGSLFSAAPAAIFGNECYVGVNDKAQRGLARLTIPDAAKARPTKVWLCPTANAVSISAALLGEQVYFVDGARGDAGRKLRCLDATTGNLSWELPVSADASGKFFITGNDLIIADKAGGLSCLNLAEKDAQRVRWSRDVGQVVDTPFAEGRMLVVALSDPGWLVVLDEPTGQTLWERPLESAPTGGPVVLGRSIWLGDANGISAFDMSDGSKVRHEETAGASGPVVTDGKRLAYVDQKSNVVVLDPAPDTKPVLIAGALPGQSPVLGDDTVVYYGPNGIVQGKLSAAGGRAWLVLADFMGKPTAPMVVRQTRVFFSTDNLGFVCAGARE